MALPQKVLEQLGREPPKTPGWSVQLLMFSSTLFFITLLTYFGITYGYSSYLNSSLQKVKDQIQAFGQQIPVDEQQKIITFYSQISNLKTLLSNHIFVSQTFDWLEKNTQANVYFSNFGLTAQENQLSLSAIAKTMDDLTQQLAIFQSLPEIRKFTTNGASFSNGFWKFDVILYFEPGFFSRSAQAAASSSTQPSH